MNMDDIDFQPLERRLIESAAESRPPFNAALHERIMRSIDRQTDQPVAWIHHRRLPLLLAAAAAVILCASLIPALLQPPSPPRSPAASAPPFDWSLSTWIKHLPRVPAVSVPLDSRLIDGQLQGVRTRARVVALNVIEASPIQITLTREVDQPTQSP
jgi:hypothetical protein